MNIIIEKIINPIPNVLVIVLLYSDNTITVNNTIILIFKIKVLTYSFFNFLLINEKPFLNFFLVANTPKSIAWTIINKIRLT